MSIAKMKKRRKKMQLDRSHKGTHAAYPAPSGYREGIPQRIELFTLDPHNSRKKDKSKLSSKLLVSHFIPPKE
jgi:hypothetical protein